jgi:type I restriction enzyme S subunit
MNAHELLRHYERVTDAPDAISKLRRFVLDLAVRGKLVPQVAGDGPASQLVRLVVDEKARLVRAGELPKAKPLPAVEEAPYVLPQNWAWVRIREVTADRGQIVPKAPFTYIDVTAINKEVGAVADPKVLTPDEAPSRARKLARKGDVIYSCVRPYLLNVAVIETDLDPEPIVSTAFAVLNGFGLVLPRYIWIVLRSPPLVAAVEEEMRGQAYPAINDSEFSLLPFPLPPLPEQHRIVAKVDELMALCDRLEAARAEREAARDRLTAASLTRLNTPDPETFSDDARFTMNALTALTTRPEQIDQVRQTIRNLGIRGRLVPQDSKDESAKSLLARIADAKSKQLPTGRRRSSTAPAPEALSVMDLNLPAGWAIARWDDIATKIGDIDHKMPEQVSSGIPYVSPRDFGPGNQINFDGAKCISRADYQRLAAKIRPEVGDIIFPRYGTIGENRLVDDSREFLASYSCCVIKVLHGYVDPEYQFLFSISDICRTQARAAENKTTQANVGIQSIKEFLIPLPPLAEQRRIVQMVQELLAICDRLELTLRGASEDRRRLLDALLQQALQPARNQEAMA